VVPIYVVLPRIREFANSGVREFSMNRFLLTFREGEIKKNARLQEDERAGPVPTRLHPLSAAKQDKVGAWRSW
jgi:hypothetical protein